MILVDTSVVLDLVRDDQEWQGWSARALDAAAAREKPVINGIVYAELSTQYRRIEALDAGLVALGLAVADIPKAALFLAGHAYARYRRAGGAKANVLSDFLIGAHAAVTEATLLTRYPARIRSYFPAVALVCPP
ncbi:MAG TPA: type II toxin-antitoxin system VapC family toxin [Rhizomicrobium sp.]|nr:type II toxin-antitoxin system VapC family toxin [Rhizomicrobium sp.]